MELWQLRFLLERLVIYPMVRTMYVYVSVLNKPVKYTEQKYKYIWKIDRTKIHLENKFTFDSSQSEWLHQRTVDPAIFSWAFLNSMAMKTKNWVKATKSFWKEFLTIPKGILLQKVRHVYVRYALLLLHQVVAMCHLPAARTALINTKKHENSFCHVFSSSNIKTSH